MPFIGRDEALRRLRARVAAGEPILGAGAGTGISAKFAERGGVDLIIIYNSGRFRMASSFMPLRAQRFTAPDEPDDFDQRAEVSEPTVDANAMLDGPAWFAIGHLVPACRTGYDLTADGSEVETLWLLAADSWAAVRLPTVRQLGPRRLWDEVESAYRWWVEQGEPDLTRFGITVTPDRQSVWLDHPDQEVPAAPGDHRPSGHQRPGR